jgi:hypothetical protein
LNQNPRSYPSIDVEWLKGNCVFIKLTKPLFIPSGDENQEIQSLFIDNREFGSTSREQEDILYLIKDVEQDSDFL